MDGILPNGNPSPVNTLRVLIQSRLNTQNHVNELIQNLLHDEDARAAYLEATSYHAICKD